MEKAELNTLSLEEFERNIYEHVSKYYSTNLECLDDIKESILSQTGRIIEVRDIGDELYYQMWSYHHAHGDSEINWVIKKAIKNLYYDVVFKDKEERQALYFKKFQSLSPVSNRLSHIFNCDFDDNDSSSGNLVIFSNAELSIFIVYLYMSCEDQCEREGDSSFIFFSFDEMLEFLDKDKDCNSCLQKNWRNGEYEKNIEKIYNLVKK